MLIQNCLKGQRVVCKENGKLATILSVSHNKGEILIAFDNAERRTVSSAVLEPATEEQAAQTKPSQPMRPCPQCATKMPIDATTCPKCGFRYGVKKRSPLAGVVKSIVVIIILVAIALVVWKFLLQR